MDHYGIGNAVEGILMAYFQTSRASGRTESLINSLKDGDRVIFYNQREATRVQRICADKGIDVSCIVARDFIDVGSECKIRSRGRTIFDHSWIKEYYLNTIREVKRAIDMAESDLSVNKDNGIVEKEDKQWHL